MARKRQGETLKIAQKLFGSFTKDIEIGEEKGHPCMVLTYHYSHRVCIIQTNAAERVIAGKLPNQEYCIVVTNPDGKVVTKKNYITAKMVKLAILKTKALDIFESILNQRKGVNTWA